MSSEEAVHVSLMEVTPTSGKGTLGTWWFLRRARARLDKTEHINRSQGQGRSYEQTIRRRGVCAHQRLNLGTKGKAHGRNAKASNRTCEIRLSGIIGGPRETQPWWNCDPASHTERARTVTLHLPGRRARALSQPRPKGGATDRPNRERGSKARTVPRKGNKGKGK